MQFQVQAPKHPVFFNGAILMEARWGCGFDRQFGWMRVYEVDEGGYILEHRDTSRGLWNVAGVVNLRDVGLFFGGCQRAQTMYDALRERTVRDHIRKQLKRIPVSERTN